MPRPARSASSGSPTLHLTRPSQMQQGERELILSDALRGRTRCRIQMRNARGCEVLFQMIFAHFFAQGAATDAEDVSRCGLIATGMP